MDLPVTRRPQRALPAATPYWILLLGTALLYLWGLSVSGWANPFYSAAAQAGSESWKAFFFGASDAAGSITVDKPPLSLWPMALSVRIFGLSSWSILVPQALAGVATVAIVHAGVKRATGSAHAALLGGAAFALTPVAVLMFRFNNPDALLVLFLTAAAYATQRAVESSMPETGSSRASGWWIALAGCLVGLAFLTKMLQGLLVLPAIGLTFLFFARSTWRTKIVHLFGAGVAMIVSASWWVVVVELWPADSRPYIGGSQQNSVLELMIGYNGVGRLTGNEVGSVSSGTGWGSNTLLRLLGPESGSQVSWLLPGAIVLSVAALLLLRRGRTTDARSGEVATRDFPGDYATRTALTLWLLWTVITWLTFSLMAGIYHSYYTVALTPSIASLVGLGAFVVWRQRETVLARRALGLSVILTTALALYLLDHTGHGWTLWLSTGVVVVSLGAVWFLQRDTRRGLPLGAGFVVTAITAAFLAPAAYSMATVASPHVGAIPVAGPESPKKTDEGAGTSSYDPAVGSLLDMSNPSPELAALLSEDAADYTWIAAVTGANSAAGFQLATRKPVMAVGGFNGTDPSPTLTGFAQLVAEGKIHYYIAGGGLSPSQLDPSPYTKVVKTGSDVSDRIAQWVSRRYRATAVDGVLLYDLTSTPRGISFTTSATPTVPLTEN